MAAPSPSVYVKLPTTRPVPIEGCPPPTLRDPRVAGPALASGVGPARSVRNKRDNLAKRYTPYPPIAPKSSRAPATPDLNLGLSSPSARFFNRSSAIPEANSGRTANLSIPAESLPHPSITPNSNHQVIYPNHTPGLSPMTGPIARSFNRTLEDPQPDPRRPLDLGIPQQSILMKDKYRVYWLVPSDTPYPWGSQNSKLVSVPSVLQRQYSDRDWKYGYLPSLKNIPPRFNAERQKALEPGIFSGIIYGFTYANLIPIWPNLLPAPRRTSRGADLYDMRCLILLDCSAAARRSHDEVLQRPLSLPTGHTGLQRSHVADGDGVDLGEDRRHHHQLHGRDHSVLQQSISLAATHAVPRRAYATSDDAANFREFRHSQPHRR